MPGATALMRRHQPQPRLHLLYGLYPLDLLVLDCLFYYFQIIFQGLDIIIKNWLAGLSLVLANIFL